MSNGAKLSVFNASINNHGLDGKSLPKTLKILSWGKNETNDGNVFLNEESVKVFEAYQKKAGRDKSVALDFDHCTVRGSKEYVAGQPKAIAAYGDPEIIPGDGLYLRNLEWTDLGKENARNYKDLSPAAVLDNHGVLLGLDSVALTPHGAVRDLNFFSSKGFNDTMLKEMSATKGSSDQGASNPTSIVVGNAKEGGLYSNNGFPADYNKDGANAGLKISSNSDDNKSDDGDMEHDEDNKDCMCVSCKSAKIKISEAKVAKDKTTKTMSANSPLVADPKSVPDAYLAQPVQYRIMNDTIVKKMSANLLKAMAADVGMEDESDSAKVLFAFLAKYEGIKPEVDGQITHKGNTSNGGLEGFEDRSAGSETDTYGTKQFSADINFLKKEIESLKTQKVQDTAKYNQVKVEELVNQASREGKIVPFSADRLKTIDPVILEEVINNQPKFVVPVGSKMRTMGVQEERKPSREKAIAAFNEMIVK